MEKSGSGATLSIDDALFLHFAASAWDEPMGFPP